jgi:hypothetical protein
MPRTAVRRAIDGATPQRGFDRSQVWLAFLVPIMLVAGILVARPIGTQSVAAAALPAEPSALLAAAADQLAAATAKGGTGYTFEIVQRSVVTSRPGGPLVPVPDPVDPRGVPPTYAATYYLIGLVEIGVVTPDGFAMEMRAGPTSADAKVDLAGGQLLFRALSTKQATYRDDGEGWYTTDRPPGIGLDPLTAARLPGLLRATTAVRETDLAAVPGELDKGATVRAVDGTGKLTDLPGVVAVDGEGFTELTEPIVFTFDAQGRLAGLIVTARNTNMDLFDLIVVTEYAFHYDAVPLTLPEPLPALAPTEAGS